MKKLVSNTILGIASGLILVACGGGDSQGPTSGQSQLLADGEACNAAWNSTTAYNGGNAVSYGGRNYTAAYWTQGNNPSTNSGPAGSGQYWITGFTCGGGATTTTTNAATTTTKAATTTTAAATTTTVASCSYPNWSSGVNYALGTIVKYAANGNLYKVVNSGTNGSDGTDPTISTWYWAVYTCSGGTTTTTVAGSGFVVTEAQFNQMFPNKVGFYTYSGLLTAMSYYPAFATTGSDTIRKQEAAAFFANVAHESDSLKAVREYNTANWPLYCDTTNGNTCASGQQYYGRGPIQLSWNYNYKTAGTSMGVDLWSNPDLVATDAAIAWRTGIWYWMNGTGSAGTTPHNAMINSQGFGVTIKAINGALECNGGRPDQVQARINFYNSFTSILGVPAGSNLSC